MNSIAKQQSLLRLSSLAAVGLIAVLGSACGDNKENNNNNNVMGCGFETPDCPSCAQDGDCCEYSINCQPGSICNLNTEDLFDSAKPVNTCIKVVCAGNSDCEAPKVCGLEKICKPEVCQADANCSPGQKCINGGCVAAPKADDAAKCRVVTRNTSLREGAELELAAVAFNKNDAALAGIEFDWESSDTGAVAVTGNKATGGSTEGTSSLTAKVKGGSVTCEGKVDISNFPNVAAGSARVVVVADNDGAAVSGATVMVDAGGMQTQMTGTNGAASFTVSGDIASVTVIADKFQFFTVIKPGTNDVFIPLPRIGDNTVAGGFRGAIDLSATKKADIQLAIAGPAIPSNLLDFGLESLIGDFVPTEIAAPELGLELTGADAIDLPGGVMAALGARRFTADDVRCQGDTPGANELGCFLARAPKGKAAGWALAGQLKLTQVTSITDELSGALGGGSEDIPIGDILVAVLPLLRTLNHAIVASLEISESAKINKPMKSGNCADPATANYDDECQADFSKYQKANMAASQSLAVNAAVGIPNLPTFPGASGCAEAAILLAGAHLEGRGLVPLGVTAALDTLDMKDTPDCKVAGIKEPFGRESAPLEDGRMALSMAPAHSGAEGSMPFLMVLAVDLENITGDTGFQASALVKRAPNGVAKDETISGSFLDIPTGTVDKTAGTIAATSGSGAVLNRYELQANGTTWLVYAPSADATVTLPEATAPKALLPNLDDAYLLSMGMDGAFKDMWTFGSGKTLDRLFDTVTSFAVQQCGTGATEPCKIQ